MTSTKIAKGAVKEAVLEAVIAMKNSEFKATGIKVELEAHLNRGDYQSCDYCDGGQNTCLECEGEGVISPPADQQMSNVRPVEVDIECAECEGEGYITCQTCDGSGLESDYEFRDEQNCEDFILNQLNLSPKEKKYLVFSRFYEDGSVDSEFTFTISLENPEAIFILPRVIEAFNALAEEIGNGMDVTGAGMHMAIINDEECYYPIDNFIRDSDRERYRNFKRSMIGLLPALYFLGSSNSCSRALGYREPRVSYENKYSAVHYGGGALEFRVFDTCYDHPEAILDNVIVISNCLRYWSKEYKPINYPKGNIRFKFGNDNGNTLNRFYTTETHLDLLNHGLRLLKPSYYNLRSLKEYRAFKLTKRTFYLRRRNITKDAELSYKEYSERYDQRIKNELEYYKERYPELPEPELELRAVQNYGQKVSLTEYVQNKIRDFNRDEGNYVLEINA